jgi:pimeloyl-ACP methyl ester carboxylesterase
MPALDRHGTKLFYEESGRGDPTFVFVHGWTCNHTYFEPQVEHFARHHRVVTVDLRGHGQSGQPEQAYTIAGFADDVAWMCSELGVDRPVVVGHSMGGTVVLELAARHPELARAVVMIDAAPIVGAADMDETSAAVLAALAGPDSEATRTAIAQHAVSEIHDNPELQARILRDMTATPQHVAVSCIEHMGLWDGEAAGRAGQVPVLHIAADNPINDASRLRALNPLLRTAQTVGGGHFNQLEVPEQVNAMIDRFLEVAFTR